MKKWIIGAAAFLTGCSGEVNKDSAKDLLLADDTRVCASSDVQRTVLSSFAAGYADLVAGGGAPLVFEAVNSSGINKDIHEVSCSAAIHFPAMEMDIVGSVPEMKVSLDYTVRPSLGKDSEFVVKATSADEFLPYRIGGYILQQTKPSREGSKQATPTEANPGVTQEFTAPERALIASASNAWADFRNGKADAEAKFDRLLDQLLKRDICWGKVEQVQAEYEFHRCGPDSLQKQSAPSPDSDAAKCSAGDHDACMRL